MLLAINGLSKSYGSAPVFSDVGVRLDESDHVGLVGANGSGKSTLLKILCGELAPDAGQVSLKKNLSIGYLKQDLNLSGSNTIYGEALNVFASVIEMEAELEEKRRIIEKTADILKLEKLNIEYLALSEKFEESKGLYYKSLVKSALEGLGFDEAQQNKKIESLSGGQKMRVALAKILIEKPDLILLDEPTNYLDAQSVVWLESYLSACRSAYIVVSHDRYFLEKTADHIWELDGTMTAYKGNYSSYVRQRDEEAAAAAKAFKTQSDYIKRQREVIRKLKSYNREKSVRRAESREKLLGKIDLINKPSVKKTANIRFDTKNAISKNVLTLRNLCVGYAGRPVVGGIDLEVKSGEKIGICGRNATGKTTLLKTLAGQIAPISGEILWGAGAAPSYFRQQHEDLHAGNTLLEELCRVSGEDTLKVRSVLGCLLFSEDAVHKKISVLSGGEISRVAVAKLMLTKSNVLLLDEPTNHLDIASKEIFEEAIANYGGTALVVSHDRYLLNLISERIVYIEEGGVRLYDCGYEQASEDFLAKEKNDSHNKTKPKQALRQTEKMSKNMLEKTKMRIAEIENLLAKAAVEKENAEAEMNEKDFYAENARAAEGIERYDALCARIRRMEDEWVALTETLERQQ
jgi:ATP-binding cassette subfamily F protein 3